MLFAGAMVGLVLADNLLVLYGFWELTSVTSFLLIGHDHESPKARAAALQALLVTGAGALAMLAGFIILGQAAGTYRLSAIVADPPEVDGLLTVALVLILLGAFTKSAQMPFHNWLPGAMVAPTPVSTYLHSATMVKAGVYLVARFSPAFADVGMWRPVVVSVGVVTMVGGGLRALRQTDLKLLLAYGTISQLGFMIAVFGWGTPTADVAGCIMLLAHGAFKAASFMVVGIVDHQRGTRDIRWLPRPGPGWRGVLVVTTIAAASMAGVPLMFGFIAKEADFEVFVEQGTGAAVALAGLVLGSVLTAAYSIRFLAGVDGRLADERTDGAAASRRRRPRTAGHRLPRARRRPRRGQRDLRRPAPPGRRPRRRRRRLARPRRRRRPPGGVARVQHRAGAVGRRPRRRHRAVPRPPTASAPCWPPASTCRPPPAATSPRCAASTPAPTGSPPCPSPARSPSTSPSSSSPRRSCPASSCSAGRGGRAGRSSSTSRSTCRSPPC